MTNELIEQYFKGLCTEEEAARVTEFLQENPDHPFLLKDWEEADPSAALPDQYTRQMFDAVSEAALKPAGKKMYAVWKLAAAACLAGIVLSLFFLNKKNDMPAVIVKTKQSLPDTLWSAQRNYGLKDLVMVLADGSKITMAAQAYVRYKTAFSSFDKREIYMTGGVFFEVAKNKKKPFVVYSRNISTTALGTAFSIQAPEKDPQLHVKLFEGKVLVALTNGSMHPPDQQYSLAPGQELDFNSVTGLGAIRSFRDNNNKSQLGTVPPQKKSLPDGGDVSYMFNNQTLADVLDQLSAMYAVDIQYSKAAIGNIYFIGKIDREDSLEKIINDIAVLNQLSVKRQKGAFILRKK